MLDEDESGSGIPNFPGLSSFRSNILWKVSPDTVTLGKYASFPDPRDRKNISLVSTSFLTG